MSNRETNEVSDRAESVAPESDRATGAGFEPSWQPPPSGWQRTIAQFFHFEEYRTNLRTEVLAGITTFMTMAYILAVNPGILSNAIFLQQPKDLFGELGEAGRNNAAVVPLDLEGYYSNFQLLVVHGRGTRCCAPTGLLYSIQVKTAIKSS